MSSLLNNSQETLPTIWVRRRIGPPLTAGIALCLLLAVIVIASRQQKIAPVVAWTSGGVTALLAGFAAALAFDRRAKIILAHASIDVVLCSTGPIAWREIVEVECFRVRDCNAVALFVTPEAQARLPTDGKLPVFAHEAFSGPPIWFTDASLEYTAEELTAEITARRRGAAGPITAKVLRRR